MVGDGQVALEVTHTTSEGLSMKAKGTGIIILLSISIGGIIFLGHTAMTTEFDYGAFMVTVMFLVLVSTKLIIVAGKMFTD